MEKDFFEREVERITRLSYIELTEGKKKEMIEHFKKMYDFVSKLKEVDTDGVKMLIYPHDNATLKMHKDVPQSGLPLLDVMKNAPEVFGEYIKAKSPIKEIKIKKNKE